MFFALTVFAGSVFGIGDVTVHSVDYSVTAGEYNNGSGIISSVRVNYSMEWSEIDSGGWHVGECCWDYMSPLHLAWAYRDSSGVGNINPVNCIWMQNESGNRWPCEFGTCFSFRGLDTLNFQIIDQDTFVIKERHWSSSGTILLPMPIGNLRIYLVGDELRWDRIYGEHNVTEFCGGFGFPRIDTLTQIDMYDQFSATGWQHALDTLRARDLAGQAIRRSRKSIIARTRQPVTGSHTLELISRDYAAHCMVTPFVDAAGKSNFMSRTTSLGDTISYVSVPRDEDGFEQYSGNTGDFLADAWEEKVFPGTDLRKNWPFGHPDSVGSVAQKWEDDDYHMRGRAFDGDDLLNYEEYRGFWVSTDESQPNDPNSHEHVRCNPQVKDVFLYFHPALDSNLLIPEFFGQIAPGYIQNIDDTIEFRVTDYSVLYGARSSDLSARSRKDKAVSFNRNSHFTLCPPLFVPLDSIPLDSGISAPQILSIWPWTSGEDIRSAFGWLKPRRLVFREQGIGNAATIPRFTDRIVLNFPAWQYVFLNYDRYNDTLNAHFFENWIEDITEGLRVNIAHEVAHGVGLTHALVSEPQDCIMGPYRGSVHDSLGIHPRLPCFSSQDSSRFSTADR